MRTGFYLTPNVDEALENVEVSGNNSAEIFLHGLCAVFGLALHQRFGYPIEYLVDSYGEDSSMDSLIHAYCFDPDSELYVDVRGATESEDECFSEFEDFFTDGEVLGAPAEKMATWVKNQMGEETFQQYLIAAKGLIDQHPEYYSNF